MQLYNIASQFQQSLENLHDENGVINESALELFNDSNALMHDKCIAVSAFINNLEAEFKAVAEAKSRMAYRQDRLQDKINWLEDYLKSNMERCGINEIKCPEFVIKIKKNPTSVDVFDENLVPSHYKIEKILSTIDRKKIKEAISQGIVVAGAGLKQNTRVEIK